MRQVDPERRLAIVEPGVVQAQLNAQVAHHGLFFAPDPATKDRCTLGGMIGNNSCGAHSAAYGKTVDNVEPLDVLLYDGTRLTLGADGAGESAAPSAKTEGGRRNFTANVARTGRRVMAIWSAHAIRKSPAASRATTSINCCPKTASTSRARWSARKGRSRSCSPPTVRLVPMPNKLALVVLGFDDVFVAADQTPWLLDHRPQALEGFDHHLPDFARAKGHGGRAIACRRAQRSCARARRRHRR